MSATIVKLAPTSIAVTGGTDVTFTKGTPPQGSHFSEVNYGNASYREREKIIVYGKEPIPNQGVFSKATRRITTQFPRDISDIYNINSLKLEAGFQPESTEADRAFQVDMLIQMLISGKYRDFIVSGVMPTE